MELERATQNSEIPFPAMALPVNVTVTAFPLWDARIPGGRFNTTRAVPENSKTATRVNPDARNLFFWEKNSQNVTTWNIFGESSIFLPERGRQIFLSVFLGGESEGGRLSLAGLSTGELCFNRSEQKCRQLSWNLSGEARHYC